MYASHLYIKKKNRIKGYGIFNIFNLKFRTLISVPRVIYFFIFEKWHVIFLKGLS